MHQFTITVKHGDGVTRAFRFVGKLSIRARVGAWLAGWKITQH